MAATTKNSVWQNHFLYAIGYFQLGDAKCIRAAGTANGKNNLAIVVPCHRVIGSNQSLTGYGGGLARKQWLLQHEAKWAHGVQQLSLPNPSKGGATERKAANE